MLFEAPGETVVPIAITNEIKEICAVRVKGRFQRAFSGISDWPRWQSWETICIVGRIYRQVGVMKTSLIGPIK